MTVPANAADNEPLRNWASPEPQYENWYILVNHPARKFSFWFRYTLLTTRTGIRECRVWAIPVDGDAPERTRIVTHALPQDAFRIAQGSWAMDFGDAGRFEHGALRGRVSDERGSIEWDFRFTPSSTSVKSVASDLVRKLFSSSSHRSPNSAVHMTGHVLLDGERIEFVNAPAHQGHTEGQKLQDGWVWGRAGGFEGDADAFFEGIAIERGGKRTAAMTVRASSRMFELNRVGHLRGIFGTKTTTEYQPGSWRLQGEEERRKIVATLNAAGTPVVKVRYLDTDGSHRFNCMYPLASCALSITPSLSGPNVSTTLLSKNKANMEFVASRPLLGEEDGYFPRF